jgi:fibronectin-binding autotransporter adhesin
MPRLTHVRNRGIVLLLGAVLIIGVGINLTRPARTAATTNGTINFQARLQLINGASAPDGVYNVEFNLYSAYTGGTSEWTEDYLVGSSTGISVSNGYLTANLGSLTAFPSTINWDQQQWLTMDIGGTGGSVVPYATSHTGWDGEMSPRLQITSVPYAFRAGQASQLADFTGAFQSTLGWNTQSALRSLLLPDEGGTLCVDLDTTNCGFAASSGSGNYIQNQNASPQTGANFDIAGSGTASTSFIAPSYTGTGAVTVASGSNTNLTLQANGTGTASLDSTAAGGTVTVASTAGTLNLASGSGATAITIGGSGANTIAIGNTQTGGSIALGTGLTTGTISIGGTGAQTGTISLGTGTGVQTINLATGGTGAKTVTLGSTASTSSLVLQSGTGNLSLQTQGTGTLGVGNNAVAQNLAIGNVTGATGITEQVGTGNYSLNGVGASTYTIGAATTTGTIAIGGTAQTGTLTLGSSTGTNILNIANGSGATTLNIANVQNAGSVNVGTGLTTGTISIGGTGAQTGTISLGTGTGVQTINLATGGTGAKTVTLGSTASTSSLVLQSGTGNLSLQTQGTGTLGVGNNAVAQNLAIGNVTGATGITEQVGTGNYSLNGVGASTYTIGAATTTGTIAIGGTAQTANITLGSSNAAQSVLIGNGTGASTVNIANGTGANFANIATSASSAQTVNIGSSNSGSSVKFTGGDTTEYITNTGDTIQTNTTNSTTAFQVQNASSEPIFLVDTTTNDLVTNPGFEVNATGWAVDGSGTGLAVAQYTTSKANVYLGQAALQVTTANGTANTGTKTAAFTSALASSTQYTLSFYAKASGSSFTTLRVGRADNGSTETTCTLNSTSVSTAGFQQYSCTFTTGTVSGSPYIFITTSDSTQHVFWLDSVQLTTGASVTPYQIGNIQLRGVVSTPSVFESASNSTTAFQIQNNTGASNLFVADTLDGLVGVGTQPAVGGSTLQVGGTLSTTGTLSVGTNTSLSTTTLTIGGTIVCTSTGCLAAGGGLAKNAVDTSTAAVTAIQGDLYTFTNSSSAIASGVLSLNNGTNTNSTLNVTASGNPTAGQAIIFASDTNATPSGNLLDLQSGSSPTSKFSVSTAGNLTLAGNISLGGTSPVTIQSTATNGTLNVDANGSGTLSLDTTGAGTISVGTNATTIDVGTDTSANTIAVGGTGANPITIGNTQTGGSIAIGGALTSGTLSIGSTANTAALNIQGGAGGITLTDGNTTQKITSASDTVQSNTTNSVTAFQVQNTSGNDLLDADTLNTQLTVTGNTNVGSLFGDTIFSDGFESGTLNLWDAPSDGVTSVQSAVVHSGGYALEEDLTGSSASDLSETLYDGNPTIYLRAWVYVASQSTSTVDLLHLNNGNNGSPTSWDIQRNTSNQVCVDWEGPAISHCGGTFGTGGWHEVELQITTGGSPVTNLWLDGSLIYNSTTISNGTVGPEILEMDQNNNTVLYYVDDLALTSVRDTTSSSLNVSDSLSVQGSASFNNQVIISATANGNNSENLFQVEGSSGTPLFNIDSADNEGITTINTNQTVVQPFTSNTTAVFQVQNNAGNSIFDVDGSNKQIVLGTPSSITGKVVFDSSGGTGTVTIVGPTTPASGSHTLTIPAITANANLCTDNSVCTGYAPSTGGNYLAKNTVDTSSAAVTAIQGSLYALTNSSSAIASGVLSLNNGTNTNSTLNVTASGNPTAGQALIFASDTNATPSGNLIDLQSGSAPTSKFSVSAAGNVSLGGTSPISIQGTATNGSLSLDANGTGVLYLDTTGAGTVSIASTSATTLYLANDANANIINIGGSGANTLALGNTQTAGTIGIGGALTSGTLSIGSTANTVALSIQGGTGGINLGNSGIANTIQIGNSSGAVAQFVNISNNTTALSTTTIVEGSNIGTSSVLIQGGTNGITLNPSGGSSSTGVLVQPDTNSTNTFQIQGSAGSTATLLNADTTNMRLGVDVTYAAMSTPGTLTMSTATTGGSLAAHTYYYKVTAVDSAGGETTASSEGSQITTGSTSTVTLKWTAVAGASGYRIYRSTTSGGETLYDYTIGNVFSGTTLSYTDTGSGPAPGGSAPTIGTAYKSTPTSNNNLQLDVGGNGTSTGQVYIGGNIPSGAVGFATDNTPESVFVSGHYAYTVSPNNGNLNITDVSNPTAPVAVGSVGANFANSVYVAGRYAYTSSSSNNSLGIIDVSNPSSPALVGSVVLAGVNPDPQSVYVQGHYAYLVNYSTGTLSVVDVSNPSSPSLASTTLINASADPVSVYVSGSYAYIADQGTNALSIFNISNPSSPAFVGSFATGAVNTQAVYVSGSYAYIVNSYTDSLQVVDISNPASPVLEGTVSTGGSAGASDPDSVYVQGRYAYVAQGGSTNTGVGVYDISNPTAPVSVGTTSSGSGSDPQSVFVSGRYAYTANYSTNTLGVYDMGGAYIQQLQVGGTETGTLQVDSDAAIGGDASIQGGLQIGANLQVAGSAGINGNLSLTASTLSAPATPTLTKTTSGGSLTAATRYYELAAVSANGTTAAVASTPTNEVDSSGYFNTLSWSAVTGATGYIVYESTNGTTWFSNEVSASTLSIIDNGTNFTWVNQVTLPTAATTGGNLTVNGATLLQDATNSSAAFQVQDASGAAILLVDTTSTAANGTQVNYLTYPGFESGSFSSASAGWAPVASSALSQNTNRGHTYNGLYSAQVVNTVANQGLTTSSFITPPPTAAAGYIVSFYAEVSTGTMAGNLFAVQSTDGTTHTCNPSASVTVNSTGFQRLSCTIAATTGTMTALQITQTDATSRTIYIDAVQLQSTTFNGGTITTPTPYQIGGIELRGVVENPLILLPNSDSTSVFQISNAAGTNTLLNVDTLDSTVALQSVSTAASLLTLTDNSASTNNVVSISATGTTTANDLLISPGTGVTSGSALKVTTAGTSAITAGLVQIADTGAYTGTGGVLNVQGGTASGTLASFTDNTATFTGTGINLSDTGTTTANDLLISPGTGVTSGSALKVTTAGTSAITAGLVQIADTGAYTGTGGVLNVQGGTASGTLASFTANALTTGVGVSIASSGTTQTTANLLNIAQTGVSTGFTGNVVNISGTSTTGAGNLLNLNFGSSTAGTALNISGGTGDAIKLATGNIIDLASSTNGNDGIIKIATATSCTSGAAQGLVFENASTQLAHICTTGTGSTFFATTFTPSSTDVAENYSDVNNDLKPGELVALANDSGTPDAIVAATSANEDDIIGVVSTDPGVLLSGISESNGSTNLVNPTPVALSGRIPTSVSTQNGPIAVGDYLTISSVSGVAMKATGPGLTIGRALEAYSGSGVGSIEVMAGVGYYAGPDASSYIQNGGGANLTDLSVNGNTSLANLNVTGDTDLSNLNVSGPTTLSSLGVTGNEGVNGTLTVDGNVNFGANLTVTGLTTVADLVVGGHIITGGGQPTSQVQTAAGTQATVTISGTDTTGTITITTGSNPTAGSLADVLFSKAYGAAPHIVLSPSNDAAAGLRYFKGNTTTSDFMFNVIDTPTANTTYQYDYFIAQ